MRKRTDLSVDSLRRKLEQFEERMRDLRWRIDSAGTTRESIEREIEIAEAAARRVKDDARAAQARMQIQAEERALAENGQVEAWKHDRDMEALLARAEDAEAFAAWSLLVATRAIDEAELSVLRAIAARMDCENGSTDRASARTGNTARRQSRR